MLSNISGEHLEFRLFKVVEPEETKQKEKGVCIDRHGNDGATVAPYWLISNEDASVQHAGTFEHEDKDMRASMGWCGYLFIYK